ncbi:MAG: LacI family DNA-binding transcriptional regulator [Gallionella sp.]|nr:LacI family DNA-binding transcriptional regulator [Gallionella sp.]
MSSKSKPVTMQDIATMVGVSRITVSKYFNGNQSIKAETRKRIEKACSDLHYVPDPHAVSLVKGKSHLVGIVLPVISEPFFAEILNVIDEEASALGLRVVIQCSYNDPAREAAALLALRAMKVHGVVLTPVASQDNAKLLHRLEHDMRVVYLDSYFSPKCHYVMNDNLQSIGLVTRYLLSGGHRPAFLGAPPVAYPSGPERVTGYLNAMREADCPPFLVPLVNAESTWDFAAFAMHHTLNMLGTGEWGKQNRTALICATDRLAIGAMAAFRKFGLEPGKDVAFVGHDDLPACEFLHPALTSVKQDVVSIGRAVIECLKLDESTFTSKNPYYQRKYPAKLIIRESA